MILSSILVMQAFRSYYNLLQLKSPMVPALEAIRGGGGSLRVGTTGTIGALMSQELESAKHLRSSASSPDNNTSRKSKPKTLLLPDEDDSSSSKSGVIVPHENMVLKRTRQHTASQIPMLVAGDASVEATPVRPKAAKKTVSVVEIVDIKCGNPDKAWMKSGLKRLGFSKLSENNG